MGFRSTALIFSPDPEDDQNPTTIRKPKTLNPKHNFPKSQAPKCEQKASLSVTQRVLLDMVLHAARCTRSPEPCKRRERDRDRQRERETERERESERERERVDCAVGAGGVEKWLPASQDASGVRLLLYSGAYLLLFAGILSCTEDSV